MSSIAALYCMPLPSPTTKEKTKQRQQIGQRLCNVRAQQTKISIGPILSLYCEESLVASNLNSKQFRFHDADPSSHHTFVVKNCENKKLIFPHCVFYCSALLLHAFAISDHQRESSFTHSKA